ncbi:MAG: hypothetical protein FGM56_10305, partial [Limnohabitans sp.]|nr:hypothetical protein [Limnohabitans sp.]
MNEEFVTKDRMKMQGLVTSKSSELTSILQNRQRKEVDVKITIMGSGHAGLAVGAFAAELGNHVICHDSDIPKIQALRRCKLPRDEPQCYAFRGLEDAAQRLGLVIEPRLLGA